MLIISGERTRREEGKKVCLFERVASAHLSKTCWKSLIYKKRVQEGALCSIKGRQQTRTLPKRGGKIKHAKGGTWGKNTHVLLREPSRNLISLREKEQGFVKEGVIFAGEREKKEKKRPGKNQGFPCPSRPSGRG